MLIAGEVAFYTITKIGKTIPFLKDFLFSYEWLVDDKLSLGQIWKIPISTFYGQASLYMFFVYGLICVVGLEPAYRWLKRKDFPIVLRGIFYMFIILGMECLLGWILYWITGYQIWYYTGWGSFPVYTSFAIAPMWFICGLISENVINVFDSFDKLKMRMYGLTTVSEEKKPNGRKIALISDVHIGRKDNPFGNGWFKGLNPSYLSVVLNKIAYDSNTSRLIIVGDFFDTWLCPPEKKPFNNVAEVINAWSDSIFMAPLKKCIELCTEVLYIPGNHDMGIKQEDLEALKVKGKELKIVEPGAYPTSYFFGESNSITKTLYFEHGHASDLFNAPVSPTDEDTIQGLPFGYYVTRIDADLESFSLNKIYQQAYILAFKKFNKQESMKSKTAQKTKTLTANNSKTIGSIFIELFIDIVVKMANSKRKDSEKLTDESVIIMPDTYNNVTIGDVKKGYYTLLKKFQDLRKNPVNTDSVDSFHRYYLLSATKRGLSKYANEKFGKKSISLWFKRIFTNQAPEKIVIMGHTHTSTKEYVMNREIPGIYVNTGCLCKFNQGKTSWAEIINTKRGCRVKINS